MTQQSSFSTDGATRPLHGQSVYDRLIEDIRQGVLKPGARLTETDLAARLSVSRTPVREALRRMETEGLIQHQPRTGAVVRRLDYPEIMELYEMRTVLESTAARLAARAASDVEIEELRAINAEMAGATGDGAALARLNRQFHHRLMDAARNRFLLKSVGSVETTMLILGPSGMAEPERAKEAVAEHEAVIAAIAARNGDAAETAMRHHMEGAQKIRLRILRHSDEMDTYQ